MPVLGVVSMYHALFTFVITVYGNDNAMLNDVLGSCHCALKGRGFVTNPKAESMLLTLLQEPLVRSPCLSAVQWDDASVWYARMTAATAANACTSSLIATIITALRSNRCMGRPCR